MKGEMEGGGGGGGVQTAECRSFWPPLLVLNSTGSHPDIHVASVCVRACVCMHPGTDKVGLRSLHGRVGEHKSSFVLKAAHEQSVLSKVYDSFRLELIQREIPRQQFIVSDFGFISTEGRAATDTE